MATKTDIYVYAHWLEMEAPKLMGILSAQQAKGKKAFSFEYDAEWLKSEPRVVLDPDIQWYGGQQYSNQKENFGLFMDSMPDTWGRTLLKRKAALQAKEKKEKTPTLYDIDYLLGVYDESRMGALRFKIDPKGDFLAHDKTTATPPWASIGELQQAAISLENNADNEETSKWLAMLIAPGSSLGGARPKANLIDKEKNLWIAKFPSKADTLDKAAWEYLAHKLALTAGIDMAPCRLEHVSGKHHTFLTKRFDRVNGRRIHFASAMTMTGNSEDSIRDHPASYLDLAEFITGNGASVVPNLHQLWRRMVFNIAISNTDDHLRNHGFILTQKGWILSPAYDLNPSMDKDGLALNINSTSNALDLDLAKSVGEYFRLSKPEMETICEEVRRACSTWKTIAKQLGISRAEQEMMEKAFLF